jgi:hypothetical protein
VVKGKSSNGEKCQFLFETFKRHLVQNPAMSEGDAFELKVKIMKSFALAAWHSGHRVSLQTENRRPLVRIPPGCKVFRSLYTLQCCKTWCALSLCVFEKNNAEILQKKRKREEYRLSQKKLL